MDIILAFLQLFFIILVLYYEYTRKSSAVFLWAMLLLLFGVMHVLTVLTHDTKYPEWVYNTASWFVILFSLCYLLSRMFFNHNKQIQLINDNDEIDHLFNKKFTIVLLSCLFLVVVFKIYAMAKFAGGLMNVSWSTGRDMSAESDYLSFSQILTCMFYPTSGVCLYALLKKKRLLIIISFSLVFLCVLVTRNRIQVLPILVAIIGYYVLTIKIIRPKHIILFVLLGFFSVFTIYALQIFRYYGSIATAIELFNLSEFNTNIVTNILLGKGDIGLRDVFYYFIYNGNNFANFEQGHTYLRMLMVFIPSHWSMGLKPPDFAISMGTAYNPLVDGFSTHPTLFGDCYANFGILGFLMGIFWAFFVYVVDDICYKCNNSVLRTSFYSSFASLYIIIGRGSVYNAFIWGVFGTILILFIYMILLFLNNKLDSDN